MAGNEPPSNGETAAAADDGARRHRFALLLFIALGLFFTALIARNADIAWIALPFLAYAVAGALLAPDASTVRLKAVRSAVRTTDGGKTGIRVSVTIGNEGGKPLFIRASDALPEGAILTDGSPDLKTAVRPGEEVRLAYTLSAARGSYVWSGLRIVVSDPFDLFETAIETDTSARVRVPPAARRMKPFPLHPWNTLSSAGSVPTRRGGGGTEFFGVREYRPGDPLSRLDWRMTARHPHTFFSRQFVLERTAEIALVLDARAATELRVGEESLFEREVLETASLAKMLLHEGHRVSLVTFGKSIKIVNPDYGKKQLHRILNFLAETAPGSGDTCSSLGRILLRRISRNAVILMMSPLETHDLPLFRKLRSAGYQVILVSPDTYDFAEPILARDEPSRIALRFCRLERRLLLKSISRLYIPVIDRPAHRPLEPLVRDALRRPLRAPAR